MDSYGYRSLFCFVGIILHTWFLSELIASSPSDGVTHTLCWMVSVALLSGEFDNEDEPQNDAWSSYIDAVSTIDGLSNFSECREEDHD